VLVEDSDSEMRIGNELARRARCLLSQGGCRARMNSVHPVLHTGDAEALTNETSQVFPNPSSGMKLPEVLSYEDRRKGLRAHT
jgi:hypothetical protein